MHTPAFVLAWATAWLLVVVAMFYFWDRLSLWEVVALTLVELIFVPDLRNLGAAIRGTRNEASTTRDLE